MVIKENTTQSGVGEQGSSSHSTTTLLRETPTKKSVWIAGVTVGVVGAALLIAIVVAASPDPQPTAERSVPTERIVIPGSSEWLEQRAGATQQALPSASLGRVVGEDPAYLGAVPGQAVAPSSTGRVVGEDPAYLGAVPGQAVAPSSTGRVVGEDPDRAAGGAVLVVGEDPAYLGAVPGQAVAPSSTGRVVGEDPAYLGAVPGQAVAPSSTGRVVGEDPAYQGAVPK